MINILKILLSLASSISRYIERNQLMEAGKAQIIAKNIESALHDTNKAIIVSRSVKHDSDSVRVDPFNRDEPPKD